MSKIGSTICQHSEDPFTCRVCNATPDSAPLTDEALLNTAAYAEVKSIEDLDWDYDHSIAEAFKRGAKWGLQQGRKAEREGWETTVNQWEASCDALREKLDSAKISLLNAQTHMRFLRDHRAVSGSSLHQSTITAIVEIDDALSRLEKT